MQLQGLWLVLAGFVLGFAISTLWEWLYYRRQRWLNHRQPIQTPQSSDVFEVSAFEEENLVSTATDERFHPAYRSPGIFLESEEEGAYHKGEAVRAIVDPRSAELAATQPSTGQNIAQPILPHPSTPIDDAEDFAVVLVPPPAPLSGPDLAADQPALITVAGALNQPTRNADQPDPVLQSMVRSQVEAALPAVPNSPIEVAPVPVAGMFDQQTLPTQLPEPPSSLGESTGQAMPAPPAAATLLPLLPPLYSGFGLRSSEYPDDLAKIFGIGDVYKQRLYAAGIYTWQQVADSDVESLRRITHAKPNADIGNWQVQARSLVKRFNRMGALYHGPPPDELTDIEGIGPMVRDALYRAGISTYGQLATATASRLAQILPAPTIGTTYHFDDWIAEAARRAPPQV